MMIIVIEIDQRRAIRQLEFDPAIIATARNLYGKRRNPDHLVSTLFRRTPRRQNCLRLRGRQRLGVVMLLQLVAEIGHYK